VREKKFRKKKVPFPFSLLLPLVWQRLCGHRRQSVPGDINKCEHCVFGVCLGFCMMLWVLFARCLASSLGMASSTMALWSWFLFQMLLTHA